MGGGATVAGAGYLGIQSGSALPAPTGPLHVLDAPSFGVLAVFAGRILPFEGADPIWVAHRVDGSLQYATPEAQADLQLVLGVLENALSGLLTRGQATLFSELTAEGKDLAIQRWGHSSVAMLRGATNSLRKLCLGNFYAPLENAKGIGYPGPPFSKPEPAPVTARGRLSKPYVTVAQAEPVAPEETEEATP